MACIDTEKSSVFDRGRRIGDSVHLICLFPSKPASWKVMSSRDIGGLISVDEEKETVNEETSVQQCCLTASKRTRHGCRFKSGALCGSSLLSD